MISCLVSFERPRGVIQRGSRGRAKGTLTPVFYLRTTVTKGGIRNGFSRSKMVCRRFSFLFVVGLPWLLTYKQVLRCAVYHAGSTITSNNFLIAVVFVTSSSLSQAKNNNQLCCNTSLYSLYWEFNPATLIATKSNHNDSTTALLSKINSFSIIS